MFEGLSTFLSVTRDAFFSALRISKPASSGMQAITTEASQDFADDRVADGSAHNSLGKFTSINPHIVLAPFREGESEKLASQLGIYSNKEAFQDRVERIRTSYTRACQLLMANANVAAAFPVGVPLAYALYPKLEPMPEDDLGAEKIGGLPDIRQFYWANNIRQPGQETNMENPPFESRLGALAKHWPVCGACRKPMTFICQIDLTDWALAIHALTSGRTFDEGSPEYWRSGLGLTRNLGGSVHRGWWYIFACRDASSHFDNPNCDAHVWIEKRYVPLKIDIPGLQWTDSEERGVDPETARKLVEAFYQSTSTQVLSVDGKPVIESTAGHDLASETAESYGFTFTPKKIVGFDIGWEFDSGVDVDWELSEEIRKIIDKNQDVFGCGSGFSLFGAPASQQEERRYWTLRGQGSSTQPCRMAPLLKFHDRDHDMTYQIYVDALGDFHGYNLYGKVDASCT